MSRTTGSDAPFDLEEALAVVHGDRDLLNELIALLKTEAPGMLAEVTLCVASNDGTGLARSAHRLRGAVLPFGAHAVAQAALALELMGREHYLSDASFKLAELEHQLLRLDGALTRFAAGQGHEHSDRG